MNSSNVSITRIWRLSETLAAAFGDPTLDVAYWLPHANHFVDSSGAVVRTLVHRRLFGDKPSLSSPGQTKRR